MTNIQKTNERKKRFTKPGMYQRSENGEIRKMELGENRKTRSFI